MKNEMSPTMSGFALLRSLALITALSVTFAACGMGELQEAGAQNPRGSAATAAAADKGGPQAQASGNGIGRASGSPTSTVRSSASESAACMVKLQEQLTSMAAAQKADSTAKKPGAGRDPVAAERYGWYP